MTVRGSHKVFWNFQKWIKAVGCVWARVSDVIHNYGECNYFFFLWVTLVAEWLEIQFNPFSRGREEGPQIDKRINQGQASCSFGQGSGKGGPSPCIPSGTPTHEQKLAPSQVHYFHTFVFVCPLVFKLNFSKNFSSHVWLKLEGMGVPAGMGV